MWHKCENRGNEAVDHLSQNTSKGLYEIFCLRVTGGTCIAT